MWVPIVLLAISFVSFMTFVLLYFLKTPEPLSTAGCEPGDCADIETPTPRTEQIFNGEYEAGQSMDMTLELLPVVEGVPDGEKMMRANQDTQGSVLLMQPLAPTNGIQSVNATYIKKEFFSRVRPVTMRVRGTLMRYVRDEPYVAGTFEANPTMFIGVENLSMTAVSQTVSMGILEPTTFGAIGFPGSDAEHQCEARIFDITFHLVYSEDVIAQIEALNDLYIELHVGVTDLDRFTMPSGDSFFFMQPFDITMSVDYREV